MTRLYSRYVDVFRKRGVRFLNFHKSLSLFDTPSRARVAFVYDYGTALVLLSLTTVTARLASS